MSIYLAQLVFLLATVSVYLEAGIVTDTKWNPRIVGGVEISIEDAPWQVAILKNITFFQCGGAIYSENIIITAAHCVSGIPPQNLTIRAGSSHWYYGGEVRQVVASKVHEYYVHNDEAKILNGSDIAVIRLDRPLTLSSVVKTIPLAKEDPADWISVTASGWGRQHMCSPIPVAATLQGVELHVFNRQACGDLHALLGVKFTKDTICTGLSKGTCYGDSGGPLVLNGNQLVGIVSWGYICGSTPSVFNSVAYYHNWLLDAIASLSQ